MTSRSSKTADKDETKAGDSADVKTETVKLYNTNDGVRGRDGGPYLDEVQARIAEDNRAYIEGRDPDYSALQPFVGVQLVTAARLTQTYNNTNLATDAVSEWDGEIAAPVFAEAEVPVHVPGEDFPTVVAADATPDRDEVPEVGSLTLG